MNFKYLFLLIAIAFPSLVFSDESASVLTVETIQVLKISGQDQRAVIKTPDGKMQVIKAGDPLGAHEKVIEIDQDKIVVEINEGKQVETVIIRVDNGNQHMERIRKTAEKQLPPHSAPPFKIIQTNGK